MHVIFSVNMYKLYISIELKSRNGIFQPVAITGVNQTCLIVQTNCFCKEIIIQTRLSGDRCAGGCSFGACAFAREQAQGCEFR